MQQHPNVPQAHPLKFRTVARSHGGPRAAVNDVIDDAEELAEYAEDCTDAKDQAQLAASKPRFEREKVIAVALGSRPTPAYEVEIVEVVQITGGFVGVQTQVSYVERGPSGPATPPDALTAPGYPHHVVRVKNAGGLITFRRVPDVTTLAVGEEGPTATTLAVGEEGPPMTTLAVGEEGPPMTTLAVGEEGAPMTTLAVGEEDPRWGPAGGGPIGGGFGGPIGGPIGGGGRMAPEDPTTMATGEEGGDPTTMATGEEGGGMVTMGGAEDPGWYGPAWWIRTRGGWGGGRGGGGPFGAY